MYYLHFFCGFALLYLLSLLKSKKLISSPAKAKSIIRLIINLNPLEILLVFLLYPLLRNKAKLKARYTKS